VQAAIQAVHADTADGSPTAWDQIVRLYDQLLALAPTPVAALNRAVAVAELQGPASGLALIDELALDRLHLFHAVRADLLARLDRVEDADAAYAAAIERAGNGAERAFLVARRQALATSR
jgi:RNA polymerase sigma-70 factor (ECF subfamily)